MEVTKRLSPGKNGTKRYLNRFGDRLLYVRYRQDKQTHKRYTTVELIVDEQKLIPQPTRNKTLFPVSTENVYVRVDYQETELRFKIKQHGAVWLQQQKRWRMRRRDAEKLGLRERIEEIEGVQ
ncbi:MAG: hypothetical protein OEY52_07180 [Gammaproteobacteria bacterium]|nr:hypothetical protein [Gammaproteobacteria bacterium]